jgi:hypothetical protein
VAYSGMYSATVTVRGGDERTWSRQEVRRAGWAGGQTQRVTREPLRGAPMGAHEAALFGVGLG